VSDSFWDTQSSGQPTSDGGTGLTTDKMQDIQTYQDAGWDLVGEIGNGTHETWQMPEEGGYPVLSLLSGYIPPQLEGHGTADNPYLISNAVDLGELIHYSPSACYRLAASIDLSGIRWGTAVIPLFAGIFDGNNLTISHLTIEGYSDVSLFGLLESGATIKNLGVVDVNMTGLRGRVGGLVSRNYDGNIATSYSTGTVVGYDAHYDVGGLVGFNIGSVTQCYSSASVTGSSDVGGLIALNYGIVMECYSSGNVSGDSEVGGLVGINDGMITTSFWDTQTSGQTASAGGTGKTTAEMQMAKTFLDGGWDFVDETANGSEDIWWILEGQDYPRLWWEDEGN